MWNINEKFPSYFFIIPSYFLQFSSYLLHIPSILFIFSSYFFIFLQNLGPKRGRTCNVIFTPVADLRIFPSPTDAYDWSKFPMEACDWLEFPPRRPVIGQNWALRGQNSWDGAPLYQSDVTFGEIFEDITLLPSPFYEVIGRPSVQEYGLLHDVTQRK